MNYNILAKFEYNGKTYIYYVLPDKPKNLFYGYMENDVIKPVVDYNDILIMQEAYKKIFISTNPVNHIKLTTTKHNGKLFQIMYDKVTGLKFFYEMYNSKYYRPNSEDAAELFGIFNKFELSEESNKSSDKKSKLEKGFEIFYKIFLFSQIIVIGSLVSELVYDEYIVPNFPFSSFVQKVEALKATSKTEFSVDKIIEAINSNPTLSEEEKAFFLEEIPYLVKNQKYVDMDDLLYKLKGTRVKYDIRSNKEYSGYYKPYLNYSEIFECSGFEDAPKDVLRHEVRHNISKASSQFATGIFEATTEAISYEYEDTNNGYGYAENVYYQKIMYEILGAEPFIAYEESGDLTYVIKALYAVIPDEQMAVDLISYLDTIISYNREKTKLYDSNTGTYSSESKVKELDGNLSDCHYNIERLLNNYFYVVKGYDLYSDVLCLALLNQVYLYYGNSPYELSVSIDGGVTSIPISEFDCTKGFFLDDYIEKNPHYSIYFEGFIDHIVGYDENNAPISFKVPAKMELPIVDGVNRKLPVSNNTLLVDPNTVISQKITVGSGIYNGLNELIKSEKSLDGEASFYRYKEQSTYVKMLCEIIGTEPFENYQRTGDINEILAPLYNIIPDKERALRLIGCIDVTSVYYEQQTEDIDLSDPDIEVMPGDVDQNLYDIRGEIYTDLFCYFSEAKGYHLTSDAIMNYYYNNLKQSFSFEDDAHVWPVKFVYYLDSDFEVSLVKVYFNQELQEQGADAFFELELGLKDENDGTFSSSGISRIVYITDENRQMEKYSGYQDGDNKEALYSFVGTSNGYGNNK